MPSTVGGFAHTEVFLGCSSDIKTLVSDFVVIAPLS